ncbi:MAG: hypothetical protein GIX03_10700 [Candidatus Eremiobacteraeota bacterium]|nr:hypothetical protein [Candidatus Eremiobacteraeota bacterium]MBC5803440.1 hypothetical protein [Candidatus Eremiobacteraeota bacterium]MBC5821505.1 hypothetical protein [Candidatus Eremiobacteraeota bacterium]
MILDLPITTKRLIAASLLGALGLVCVAPAGAAIETDPIALYQTMRKAFDEGSAKQWPFASELYYQSTVFDAGRAYSLFRPADPNYAAIANLAIDVATQLHYNPLTNNDGARWYVREAAVYAAKNGDDAHKAEATALLSQLDAGEADAAVLARQAEDAAVADGHAFHGDPDAQTQLLIADVRAYNLTKDPQYRSLLLQHAAAPGAPLTRVPDPEYGQLFAIAASALGDPGYTDADRRAAHAIAYRRAHTPELQLIARLRAIPHELRLTRTAPADEYFGHLKYSPLGVRNEVIRVNKYLDRGWGERMEGDALQVDSAVEDWQKQYPHDTTLPANLLDAYRLLERVDTDATKAAADRVKNLLVVEYASSRQAQELAST